MDVSVLSVLGLCYLTLGLVASSSLTCRFEQATPVDTAGVVHKSAFERSEREFYGRKQRYPLSVLPSSPLYNFATSPKFIVSVMSFSRVRF